MQSKQCFQFLVLSSVLCFSGCTHLQLRRNVVRQTQTLSDLYEQQVLDNLAAFVVNPGSTPSFALADGGGSTMSHANSLNGALNWSAAAFVGGGASMNGSRSLSQAWTLEPINNPKKLELMKCVYQYATRSTPTDCGVDCHQRLSRFFGDKIESEGEDGEKASEPEYELSSCELPQRFFYVNEHRPLGSIDKVKYGQRGRCFVLVYPDQYECLSRLTMAMLEIATMDDEDFGKAFVDTTPTVDVNELFIGVIDEKPRLIQGSYTVDQSQFDDYRKDGVSILNMIQKLATDELKNFGAKGAEGAYGTKGLDSKSIKIQQPSTQIRGSSKSRKANSINSRLQLDLN